MEKYTKKCAYRKIGLGLFSVFVLIGLSSQDASAVSNEKTITVSSNYDAWYKCSWWGQRPLGTGYVSVTHRIGMASGSSSIMTGENINFAYKPDLPFFLDNQDGVWDTPYGVWKDSIDTVVSAVGGQEVGKKSCGPHTPAVAGLVKWSAQKPNIKLVSSDDSIIRCSGMSCSGVGDGTATITAEIDKTQSRMWGYMHFKEKDFYGEGAHVRYNIDHCKLTTVHGMSNLTTDVYGCRNSSPSSTYVDDKAILELPTTSLSWEVRVSSAPSNGCFQRTNYPVTYANAITQCKGIGSTWDLVTVEEHWDDAVAFGHTGYVKDAPKTISSSKKCSYDHTWPENSKGVLIDTKNKCVSDVPKSTLSYGICYSASCNACAGSIPSGSVMCAGDDADLPNNGNWTKSGVTAASCTAEKCQFFTPVATTHTASCDVPLTLGAGSHFVKVPINAKNQIIELWGAGAGGGGDSGKASRIIATAGGRGGNTVAAGILAEGGGPGSVSIPTGAGGVATGGDINTNGSAGQVRRNCTSPGKGGDGANSIGTAGSAPAGSGGEPGGGGGGGYYNAVSCAASGGGGGAYSKKTVAISNTQDVYIEVGAGGVSGIGQGSTGSGGRGGDGKAIISFACGVSFSCSGGAIPEGSKMCPGSDEDLLLDGTWSPTTGTEESSCTAGAKCQYYTPNCTCNNDAGVCIGTKYANSCGQPTCDGKKDCRNQNWQEVSPE